MSFKSIFVKWLLYIFILTFSLHLGWPFKFQFYAEARAPFNLNSHCGTVPSFLDGNDVHWMGQCCPFPLLITEILNIAHCSRLFGGEICLYFQMEWGQGRTQHGWTIKKSLNARIEICFQNVCSFTSVL